MFFCGPPLVHYLQINFMFSNIFFFIFYFFTDITEKKAAGISGWANLWWISSAKYISEENHQLFANLCTYIFS